jgi:hypothetical protein
MLAASLAANITIVNKNFAADIAGCADISSIATANSVAGDPNIAAHTAYACFLYNAFASAFTAYACFLYNAFALPTPSLPSYRALPTPPPIGKLPTSWRKVLCRKCHREAHDISYRHCIECHFKENGYPSYYHDM